MTSIEPTWALAGIWYYPRRRRDCRATPAMAKEDDDGLTIDCQVHAYQRNTPERPWMGFLTGPEEVTGDDMVEAMAAVGVDGAILISPFAIYAYDASYALEVYAQHPTKSGLVRPFDPNSENN